VSALSLLERDGARLFRDRCEGCHAARLSADDPTSRVPEERWEAMILSEAAPIVWGSAGYKKTGVMPYVHPEGARTPSLRRLHKKYPYFTNGSAKSIDDVLDGVRFTTGRTFHAKAPENAERLDETSKRALRAFLDLL
jgi:cytochrome c peroxidase